jgi:hypothetical protein
MSERERSVVRSRPLASLFTVSRYFTGAIRCWYGVPAHIT